MSRQRFQRIPSDNTVTDSVPFNNAIPQVDTYHLLPETKMERNMLPQVKNNPAAVNPAMSRSMYATLPPERSNIRPAKPGSQSSGLSKASSQSSGFSSMGPVHVMPSVGVTSGYGSMSPGTLPSPMGVVKKHITAKETSNVVDTLQKSIYEGDVHQAVKCAQVLAQQRALVKMDLDPENTITNPHEKDITLKVKVEDKTSSGGYISLKVKPSYTIRELKRHMLFEYSFPPEVQKWIIGKRIPKDDETLYKCHIKTTGSTVYLYLMSAKDAHLPGRDVYMAQYGMAPAVPPSPMSPYLASVDTTISHVSYQGHADVMAAPGHHPGKPPVGLAQPIIQAREPATPQQHAPSGPTLYPNFNGGVRRAPRQPLEQGAVNEAAPPARMAVAPQPARQQSVGNNEVGWECPNCTFINQPTRPGCSMCATDRPAEYAMPENYEITEDEQARLARVQELEMQALEAERERQQHEVEESRRNFQIMIAADESDLVPNVEEFECPVCFDDIDPGEGVMLRECLHHCCKSCLSESIRLTEEPYIRCPYSDHEYSCPGILQDREIKALVTEEIYLKFLQRGLSTAESQEANSYHCKTADCPGWCIYEDDVNFFPCPVCEKSNCLTCKSIHEGLNCREYQDDLKRRANNDDAAKRTADMLERLKRDGEAMDCPKCHVIVQKKDGCDWIKCTMCKTEICWVTRGPRWGINGPGDTSGGCQCRLASEPCHPNCQNCH